MKERIVIGLYTAFIGISMSFNLMCDPINNGTYKVSYNIGSGITKVIINNSKVKGIHAKDIVFEGGIEKIENCLYRLNYKYMNKYKDSSELGKKLKVFFDSEFIEISNVKGDTLFFRTTYKANLHISKNSGIMVKSN